jgi:DNA (cytosine-5)-methyltransferase 1
VRRKLIIIDLLCGAGGSSTGCIRALLALGWSMEDIILACVNHSPVAIDTHSRNHPQARHYCQDIATVKQDANERAEQETILETYLHAMGMI